MPDKRGRTAVSLPADVMERVKLAQAMLANEGVRLSTGLVACYLIDLGFAAKTQNTLCHVSSASK